MDIAAERSYPTPLANVTLLPMLLMSLMRQKNCPRTTETVKREYDYIIVGAGSAGSVVASRLSELPCVSVLLLEAGKPPPLLSDVPALSRFFWFTDIDWQYKTVPQMRTGALLNNRQVVWPGGKAIGGSSILNGMLYVRGNRRNFDQWAAEGAEGWSYKDVLPYFKKMEDNRDSEYVANGYHGVRGPQTVHRPRYQSEMKNLIFKTATSMGYKIVDPNGPFQTGFYDLQSTMRAGQRCSTAKAYLVPAENRTNLNILPHAFVKKILIKKRRAVGVHFDYDGRTFVVNAKREVIISAGTVNTAHLLMLSGIGPRRELERFKIPVVADLPVGRNLQDHCSSNVDFELDSSIQPSMEKLTDPDNIEQYIYNRTGPLGSPEFFNAVAFLKNKVIAPNEDFPDYQILFAESNSGAGLQFGLTPQAQTKIYQPYEGKPFYSCFSSSLQPRSRGTVTLQSDDPYDPPLIDPNYFDDPRDMDNLVEGLKVCNRIGNSPALKKIGSVPRRTLIPGCEKYAKTEDLYLRCQVRAIIMTASHPVGTARMGNTKDPRTVVDSELRVKTLNGLRVIDASVMPIIPSGNINAATIMIAEKASDIIKSSIECHTEKTDDDQFPILEEIAFNGGPIYFTQSAAQTSKNQSQSAESTTGDSENVQKSTDEQENLPSLIKKHWTSNLQASEVTSRSKDSISLASRNSNKLTNKPLYGYVPNNNKQRNSDMQASGVTTHSNYSVLLASSNSNKPTEKPLYGYVPPNNKQRNSDLQTSDVISQSNNSVFLASRNSDKPTEKTLYGYVPLNNKQRISDLQSSDVSNQSKDDVSATSTNYGKLSDKRKRLFVRANKKQKNSDLKSSEIPHKSEESISVIHQDDGKSTDNSQYEYVPDDKKQRNSDLQPQIISSKSEDGVFVLSHSSDKSTDKPQYGHIPVNKKNWKGVSPNNFAESEDILSNEPWNREIMPSDFNDFVFSGNGSFFQNNEKPFDTLTVKPYLKQTANDTRIVQNSPQMESLSDDNEEDEDDHQRNPAPSQSTPQSNSDRIRKFGPMRIQSQKSKISETIISKNLNKKRFPSKFDSLRVKIGKQKSFLLSVNDNAKKFFEDDEENQKQSEPDSTIKLPNVNPNAESDSDIQSDFNSDSDENINSSSSCENDFCNSLISFANCDGTKSCQKKLEFASLLYELLCNDNE